MAQAEAVAIRIRQVIGAAFKVIVAFCVGLGALYGAQRTLLNHVLAEIASQPPVPLAASVKYEPIKTIDPEVMRKAMGIVGPIDTATGQRLAVEGAARPAPLPPRCRCSRASPACRARAPPAPLAA